MTDIESLSSQNSISILYVDDEEDLLTLSKLFLERTGDFQVDTITSAYKALNSSNIKSYDAIVSDYQMPDMDGITFLKKVREKYGDIPFILFIGGRDEKILIEAINNGADFFLQKSGSLQSSFTELIYGIKQSVRKKRADEALRDSEEKFRSFVEDANEIVFSLDPNGVFTYVSPKWTELLGYEISEVIGKPAKLFIHPDDYPRLREIFIQTCSMGKRIRVDEYRVPHKNGTWLFYIESLTPIFNEMGNIVRVQGIGYDITERKRSEDALIKANRQLNLLTSITRHDILNKITIIRGILGIMEMEINDFAESDYFRMIKSATNEIQTQIEFTRVYSDLGTQDPQWIELDTILPYSSVPSHVILIGQVQDLFIFTDPMLEKVFFNLLDNSIQHGQRVTEIRVSYHKSEDNLIVVWEDNGVGISGDEKELIFERGFGKNSGFGMFLAREILSLTGIRILENGEESKGARFEIIVQKEAFRKETLINRVQ